MPSDPFDLSGRVAVVTGAAHGIGKSIAIALARHGANVGTCDLDDDGLQATVEEIEALGRRGFGVRCDVGQVEEIDLFFAEIDRRFDRVDVLVNNVGHVVRAGPEDLTLPDLDYVLRTGLIASFRCAQEAFRRMVAGGRGGSIVNISSIAGATALGRGNVSHSVNKGAIHQMTREMAVEWAKHGIRVNAILPCQVLTEGFQKWLNSPTFDPALYDRFLLGIPMNRLAVPEDIAGPVVFLASDAAAMVTGTLLPVDGGNLALNAGGSHTWTTA